MGKIRQASDAIALFENGELNTDLQREIELALKTLYELAPPKGSAKGKIVLTLDFAVDADSKVAIDTKIETKMPKKPRGSSWFFVTEDGELSTEHPKQHSIFDTPYDVSIKSK